MIENIVRRAKKIAVKREIASKGRGLRKEDLFESIRQEFRENEDLPNTTNPDDWARISGKKGERIIFIRTLDQPRRRRREGWSFDPARGYGPVSLARCAIAKVLGIETEYGIAGGPDFDPITSSSIIVNAYAQQGRTRINWDFDGETPDMDARGRVDLTSFAPDRRDSPGQHRPDQWRAPLRRPRPPRVLLAGVSHAA